VKRTSKTNYGPTRETCKVKIIINKITGNRHCFPLSILSVYSNEKSEKKRSCKSQSSSYTKQMNILNFVFDFYAAIHTRPGCTEHTDILFYGGCSGRSL
jgi:hypothetical protein